MDSTGTIFMIVGGVQALIGLILGLRARNFAAGALPAQGVVVGLVGGETYSPQVRFSTPDGTVIEFVDSGPSSDPPSFSIGEEVRVLYRRENPQKARIGTFFRLYAVMFFLLFMGLLFGGIGFVMR